MTYFNEIPLTKKYRPSKLSECVLPLRISKRLEKWKQKQPNHLIFYGNAGVGKTSTAIALAKELAPDDYIIVNASKNNDDNFINNYVSKVMRSISLYGQKRIIILDESDRLTENAQTSLRRPLEEFSHLCSIIFTFNYDDKVIELLDDISKDLFNYDLEFRIQELESRFSKDMSETTFNELKELKNERKIN